MIILLEGPEAAGKSSLAERLAKENSMRYIHHKQPKTQFEKDTMFDMYKETILSEDNAIIDRAWYSEMVYGAVMRDKSYISELQMLELEHFVKVNSGGFIIHCTDGISQLWKRCNERGEDYVLDIETLAKLKVEFEVLMHDTRHLLPVVRYEISKSLS